MHVCAGACTHTPRPRDRGTSEKTKNHKSIYVFCSLLSVGKSVHRSPVTEMMLLDEREVLHSATVLLLKQQVPLHPT